MDAAAKTTRSSDPMTSSLPYQWRQSFRINISRGGFEHGSTRKRGVNERQAGRRACPRRRTLVGRSMPFRER